MLSQILFNNLVKVADRRSFSAKVLILLRKLLLMFSDPVVKFPYHEFKINIPLSHDLPFNMRQHPLYNLNLGVIAAIIHKKYPQLKVIDVGANIGDSVAIIQHMAKVPVLCVEGNPKFIPLLNSNLRQFSNVEVEESFVGETKTLVNPNNNLGTAFLEKADDGIQVCTMEEVLSRHSSFKESKLLKIDTDGFDNQIIRASVELLSSAKPIVFFEYDPFYLAKQNEEGLDIFQFLSDLNYSSIVVFDNLGMYLTTVKTDNKELLKDLHRYFNRHGASYMDLCVFHQNDVDLLSDVEEHFT